MKRDDAVPRCTAPSAEGSMLRRSERLRKPINRGLKFRVHDRGAGWAAIGPGLFWTRRRCWRFSDCNMPRTI
jgi:hypothetical protein